MKAERTLRDLSTTKPSLTKGEKDYPLIESAIWVEN
jgi:hypothetical protein